MTDRIKGLTVTLAHNMREDDAKSIVDAIKMLRGVVAVDQHIANVDHHFAKRQAQYEMQIRINDLLTSND